MGKCEDCKYWDKSDGECVGVGFDQRSTQPSVTDGNAVVYFDSEDTQGLVCGFVTGPEFGCVNFKVKKG